tara:strand:+ start:19163 stop:19444 length:282 start_codon:yes stop_codon:yes gene_type:complete
MKALIFILALAASAHLSAENLTEEQRLSAACEKAMSSPFRNKNTSTCEELETLRAKQAASPEQPKDEELEYRWNGLTGKHCYFNKNDEVVSCP